VSDSPAPLDPQAPLPPPVVATPSLGAHVATRDTFDPASVASSFVPLQVAPPPHLFATWWLRYMLLLTQLVAIVVVLLTAYSTAPEPVVGSPLVVVPHAMAAVLLVGWSALAMLDAGRLLPSTRYKRRSSASEAVALWIVALAAPLACIRVVWWARDRFAERSDDTGAVLVTVVAVLATFVAVWSPFRYHARQAHRIGAPARVINAWFWVPLLAAVGGLAITALGLHDMLTENGVTPPERMVQVGVLYGIPALVLALSTWRATTVFDEVIDLRWRRWRTDWEQTIAAMTAQPPPGPEMAPAHGFNDPSV
jgi:hypothetical protein